MRTRMHCNFEAVSAEQDKQQYIPDGIYQWHTSSSICQQWPEICQQWPESITLTLDEEFRQAKALEITQKQCASYENNIVAAL